MSSAQRYRNLILYLTRIYSAQDSVSRTEIMRDGLDSIMTTLAPMSNSEWEVVMNDVRRLLNVWEAKETDVVARGVVLQIEDMLKEFSQPSTPPKLTISEKATRTPTRTPVISHVVDTMTEGSDDMTPLPEMLKGDTVDDDTVDDDADDAGADDADDEEDIPEVENANANPQDEEEEEEDEDDIPEPDPEVVMKVAPAKETKVESESEEEEEESEEEEAEMEVEQITLRGKSYWHDAVSGKLFAVLDGDEVGDEIGILVNGKMQTLVRAHA